MEQALLMRRATRAAVALGAGLAVLKGAAWLWTGSVSLLASLVDSLLDTLASAVLLVAVHASLQPADHEHRFGHGKLEQLAALAQALFVSLSCLGLVWAAVERLRTPAPVEHGWVGLAVMGVASAATWALVRFQQQVVARTGSSAIAADSLHYRGDLLMNGAVALSLVAAGTLGWTLVDPLLGLVVAAIVGHSAWQIGSQAVQNLMDREFPDHLRQRIRALVLAHPEVRGVHDLRTRQSGLQPFIQFHLELDGEMTLNAAHRIVDQVERDLQAAFPGAEVMVHADPDGEPREGLQG